MYGGKFKDKMKEHNFEWLDFKDPTSYKYTGGDNKNVLLKA